MILYRYSRRALFVATAVIPLVASAQLIGRDPLNSPTTGPTTPYQSAFTEYKNYQDSELMSWRAANDVVGETGGMAQMDGMGGDKATKSPATGVPHDKAGKEEKSHANMEGMEGMKGMGNMPGHDMSNMKSKPAPTRQPVPITKPAASKPMPGHSGMQKQ